MTPAEEFKLKQDLSRKFHGLSNDDENRLLNSFPDKKYFEFVHHHWHNRLIDDLENRWMGWSPWEAWSYPIDDLIRYKKMLLDHSTLIEGGKIADLGSHLGVGVLFCLNIGAERCVGIEPISDKNKLASFICGKSGFDNFEFLTGEIKQESIYQRIKNFDTMILGSLIDMIPDHYRLMENVAKTGIQNIIVEVAEDKRYAKSEEPHINWYSYDYKSRLEGPFNPAVDKPLHGEPNLAFLKMLMAEFGYRFQKQEFFHMQTHEQRPKLRSVSVFQQSSKEDKK